MKCVSQKSVLLALSRYYHGIHRGAALYAARHGWHLNCDMGISGVLPQGWKGDGILTLLADRKDVLQFVLDSGLPVVDLAIGRPELDLPRVIGDNVEIGRLAGEHFLERAFRHFAWFSNNSGHVAALRRDSFFATVRSQAQGMEDWTFSSRNPVRGQWQARLARLAGWLESVPKPVAVFAFRDADAAHVLDACLAVGLCVPTEVSILGVGNDPVICESVRVPLSSVNHNLEELGFRAARLLDGLMGGAPLPGKPLLVAPGGVTLRQSTDVLAVRDPRLRFALRFIEANLHRRIGVPEVEADSGVSRRVLEREFSMAMGCSVSRYIHRTRLAKAKSMLTMTRLAVADVAARAGFNTPQYFNNVFRSETGETPRQYRLRRQGLKVAGGSPVRQPGRKV